MRKIILTYAGSCAKIRLQLNNNRIMLGTGTDFAARKRGCVVSQVTVTSWAEPPDRERVEAETLRVA